MTPKEAAYLKIMLRNTYKRLCILCEYEERTNVQHPNFNTQLDLFNTLKEKAENEGWKISEIINS